MQKKQGRPVEKENRTKVGLSLDGSTNDKLSELAAMTGKTKSRIVEEAISMFAERQSIIEARIQKVQELGDDAFLDIDEILEKRLKRETEESTNMEVRNVG